MKASKILLVTGILLAVAVVSSQAQDLTAKEIVKRADAKMRGEKSSYSTMTMTIVRPTWKRTISFKNWTKGTEYSLALITSPAKEKGQAYLKRENEMWSWNPTINRMIKLPPSMLAQGWMGSDFTNDDLLNESSVVVDYTHKKISEEDISSRKCYKIELIPLEDAAVVWGKIYIWISVDEYLWMKAEYYDEDEYLIKTELAYDIKNMDGRIIPAKYELIPADKEGHKTVVVMDEIKFNIPLSDEFFSQQNMKKVR
jgi:outer membrane lipoprotein-sorting protein